jgi:FMN phosphatase YigB (HAD superfamily)
MQGECSYSSYTFLHIGDEPGTDGLAAFNAGVDFLWMNRKQQLWPDEMEKPRYELCTYESFFT